MTGLRLIEDARTALRSTCSGSVDMIIADPPYGVSRPNHLSTMRRSGIEWAWDDGAILDEVLLQLVRILKPGGSIVLWHDWKMLGHFASRLDVAYVSDIDRLGVEVKRPLFWMKSNPMPRNTDYSFLSSVEMALWGVKRGKRWTFNGSDESGIWRAPVQKHAHLAKKPDEIYERLIRLLTNKGDVVLDPFAGAGTTAWAAEKLGRHWICIEKDPQWEAFWPKEKG